MRILHFFNLAHFDKICLFVAFFYFEESGNSEQNMHTLGVAFPKLPLLLFFLHSSPRAHASI